MEVIYRKDLSNENVGVVEIKSCFEDLIYHNNLDLNLKYISLNKHDNFKDYFHYVDSSSTKKCGFIFNLFYITSSTCKDKTFSMLYNRSDFNNFLGLSIKTLLDNDEKFIGALLKHKNKITKNWSYYKSPNDIYTFDNDDSRDIGTIGACFIDDILEKNNYEIVNGYLKKIPKGKQIIKDI